MKASERMVKQSGLDGRNELRHTTAGTTLEKVTLTENKSDCRRALCDCPDSKTLDNAEQPAGTGADQWFLRVGRRAKQQEKTECDEVTMTAL